MLSLGIVASANNPPSELPPGALTGAFLQAAGDTSDADSYTFADQNIGTGSETRLVVAVLASRNSTAASLTSATIGGITATIATQVSSSGNTAAIAYALVPTGAAATVVANWSGIVLRCGLGLWRITGGGVTVTTNNAASSASPISADITGAANGFIIAGSACTNPSSYTWTDATERYDAAVEAMTHSGADSAATGAVTVQASAAATSRVLVVAAFAPA